MTVSADGLAKQIFVRRIVLIDEELIWKIEPHAAKRISIARWLIFSNRAVAVATDFPAIRASAVGSWETAGRYSFRMMDGGTFHVGLNVMYFIVSASRGVACFPG